MTDAPLTKSAKHGTRSRTLTAKNAEWAKLVALANAERRSVTGEVIFLAESRILSMDEGAFKRYEACLKQYLDYEKSQKRGLMTANDIAERWGISRVSIDTMRQRGKGPASFKIGGRAVYKPEDVYAYEVANGIEPKGADHG
jgi:predicted DNA-binding transcriptional regulator AlpA